MSNATPRFFVLEGLRSTHPEFRIGGTDAVHAKGSCLGDPPRCEACGRAIGLLALLPPYRVEIETWGHQFGDVVILGDELIVTERFRTVYEEAHLTGLADFEPIEIVRTVNHRRSVPDLPRFFKTEPLRTQAMIDQSASGFEWEDENSVCPVCLFDTLKRFRRLVIRSETWTGEDIFTPKGSPERFVVSERFVQVCGANGIRNVHFIPAEEFCYDFQPWEE